MKRFENGSLHPRIGISPNPGPFAREEKDFNVSTTEGETATVIARTCETGCLWTLTGWFFFCRLTFFTFEFYKRNILLQLAQKATAGRGHDTGTCISGQARLRSAPWHISCRRREGWDVWVQCFCRNVSEKRQGTPVFLQKPSAIILAPGSLGANLIKHLYTKTKGETCRAVRSMMAQAEVLCLLFYYSILYNPYLLFLSVNGRCDSG